MQPQEESTPAACQVKNLNFAYSAVTSLAGTDADSKVLDNVTLSVKRASRTLLVGANGAGKSTLLRILGGKHMHADDAVQVLGKNAFRDTTLNNERTYIDAEWGLRTVAFAGYGVQYSADIPVRDMMTKLQDEFPERREKLMDLLSINPEWRMHKISDGQRRRVQLFLALLRPVQVIFMDEVTAILDLVVRQDLLNFLREESETRGVTILYATNILDGLDEWATDIVYLRGGSVHYHGRISDIPIYQSLKREGTSSPLLKTVEYWLREELQQRRVREKELGIAAVEDAANPMVSAGGYAPGRLMTTVTRQGGGFDSGRHYDYWG